MLRLGWLSWNINFDSVGDETLESLFEDEFESGRRFENGRRNAIVLRLRLHLVDFLDLPAFSFRLTLDFGIRIRTCRTFKFSFPYAGQFSSS